MKRWLIVLIPLLLIALTACAERFPEGITIENAWVRPSPLPDGNAAAYMEIHNGGPEDDILISVKADFVESTQLHESVHEGDMATMHEMDGIAISAGQKVVLEPGGYHVMLITQQRPLEADETVTLTLIFEKAGEIQIQAEVRNE